MHAYVCMYRVCAARREEIALAAAECIARVEIDIRDYRNVPIGSRRSSSCSREPASGRAIASSIQVMCNAVLRREEGVGVNEPSRTRASADYNNNWP